MGAGLCENMANSAQFQVKLPTGVWRNNIGDGLSLTKDDDKKFARLHPAVIAIDHII